MVKGLEHVGIFSPNSKRLSEWYQDMFGLKVVYDNGKGTYFLAFESGDMFEIMHTDILEEKKSHQTVGLRHLALAIDVDDFEAMVEKLLAAGVEQIGEVVSNEKVKTFFFRDIDGNVAHLIARHVPLA